ncbi:MAG: hypothetical protein ABI831_08470 [Betaproteobacteria bacterium]
MMKLIRSWKPMAMLVLVSMFCSAGTAEAQVPHKISYQGVLTDSGGTPITAPLMIAFRLYSVPFGGAALYTETQSVSVSNGQFAVLIGSVAALTLPFDVPYFLGTTVGSELEMAPRQPLGAAPYAIRSATAEALAPGATMPAISITGTLATAQIATNAVTQGKLSPTTGAAPGKVLGTDGTNLLWLNASAGTVTSVATGTGLTGGPITATGTINLAATQLLPTVACTTNFIPKWSGSAWICAADASSGGTVTSVTATSGGGLATTPGGGITATGSVGIAAGGIATAMIADGAVTTAKLAVSQQLPTCADGQAIRLSGATWVCYTLPPTVNPVFNGGPFGISKVTMPADGIPLIGILDPSGYFRLARCLNSSCSSGATVSAVIDVSSSDLMPMALGSDGFAVFAYDITATASTFAKCNDALCTGPSFTPLGAPTHQDSHTVAIGTDGFPVIAYRSISPTGLVATKCANPSCTSQASNTVDATATPSSVAIAIGTDTFPVISYYDSNVDHLKVAKCINVACNGTSTLTVVDTAGSNGRDSSIRVPADGLPVISYRDSTNNRLRVAKCVNPACSGSATLTTVDTKVGSGQTSSLAIASDGLPIISYYEATDKDLRIVKCGNAACNSGNSVFVADSYGDVGNYSSIVLGIDGNPIITYQDATGQYVKAYKCSTPTCSRP